MRVNVELKRLEDNLEKLKAWLKAFNKGEYLKGDSDYDIYRKTYENWSKEKIMNKMMSISEIIDNIYIVRAINQKLRGFLESFDMNPTHPGSISHEFMN